MSTKETSSTRVWYVPDITGSDKCFRKVLNAAKREELDLDLILLTGNLTGKRLAVAWTEDGSEFHVGNGETLSRDDFDAEKELLIDVGVYLHQFNKQEFDDFMMLEGSALRRRAQTICESHMKMQLKRWRDNSTLKLKDTKTKILVTPGTGDPLLVDSFFDNKESPMVLAEGKHIKFRDIEIVSTGYTDRPNCDGFRRVSSDELKSKIDKMAARVKDFRKTIFNLQAPAQGVMDLGPQLRENNTVKPDLLHPDGVSMVSIGSERIRNAIAHHRPVISLHGQIRDNCGQEKLGDTMCINPGSESEEGYVRGVLIIFSNGKLKYHTITREPRDRVKLPTPKSLRSYLRSTANRKD